MKSSGLTTSLDTNDDPDDRWDSVLEEILPHLDILLPNEREAMKMSRANDVETALSRLAQKAETVVVKMGASGALAIRNGRRFGAPAVPVTVVDPIGAGDSFDGGFLHQFLRGADLTTCLAYGNLCGAFSTTDFGGRKHFATQPECRNSSADTTLAIKRNRFWALNKSLDECAYYAAFWRTRDSVLVCRGESFPYAENRSTNAAGALNYRARKELYDRVREIVA